jgi:ComF family protein
MPQPFDASRLRLKWVSRSLFAQDCQLCARACGGDFLCRECLESLPKLGPACPRCAMPMALSQTCGQCLKSPPHFDATRAALRYDFPADQLILGLKYGARLPLADLLGDLLVSALPSASSAPCLMIPMPLHRTRFAERGFNQALEIARRLASSSGRAIHTEGIVRIRDTVRQADLSADKRKANVRGAFECNHDLSGTAVAIVDDVMTTGASLNELARVLKRAGATSVENWVVARTWPDAMKKVRAFV